MRYWWLPVVGVFAFMILAGVCASVWGIAWEDGRGLCPRQEFLHAHRTAAMILGGIGTLVSIVAGTICIYITNGSIEVVGRRLKWNHGGYA